MSNEKILSYFKGDTLAANTWKDKYCMKDRDGNPQEQTPTEMHFRMAKEFARIEFGYNETETKTTNYSALSKFGQQLLINRKDQTEEQIGQEIFNYFYGFEQIVPQGSLMANLGNSFVFGSLSNCFGIAPPQDSYGGIMRADQELVQLMKRRGGVGTHLNNLRYSNAPVTNAAKSSSGVPSFAERFSNSTREVAQEGRRGALMLLLSCKHPDIFKFVTMKDDETKVTGANVSVMFTDDFMFAVENDDDFYCTFPIDVEFTIDPTVSLPYNTIVEYKKDILPKISLMKIKALELFNLVAEMAHKNGEPGVAFTDRIEDYCPDGVYDLYAPTLCNPCAEQWFSADETCRLIAENFFGFIDNPFTTNASINFDRVYEMSYMQQRLGDDLVDLEVEYISRIINKLYSEIHDKHGSIVKEAQVEIELWERIKIKAQDGRRTGSGLTGLADMLAALNLPYVSPKVIEQVMKKKMEAELDATIDMAILRGTFIGWNKALEFIATEKGLDGQNSFFSMLCKDFPIQADRMLKYGRRNVSWSTVAPTGTVSLMTQTTSGLEPLFKAYYIRKKKINSNDPETTRVDFTDGMGDKWQEYPVLHPKFRDWVNTKFTEEGVERYSDDLSKDGIEAIFKLSPWFNSQADDINWKSRLEINSIIQKYTTNALSCTINLPKDVDKEVVKNIYLYAWKKNLKGVTVYREGSRTDVLSSESKKVQINKFGYIDSVKRPKELQAHYYYTTCKGKGYGVIIGLLDDQPYELFAFENPIKKEEVEGTIAKMGKGQYCFKSVNYNIDNLHLSSESENERLLTRWVSMSLRHGISPKFIAEQVQKSEVVVTSFATVVSRILKRYIADEAIGETCPDCKQQNTMRYEEGCKKCTNCSYSKC